MRKRGKQRNSKKRFLLKFLYLFFISYTLFFISKKVYAADFRSDYEVEYFLTKKEQSLNTQVKFNIKVTNLRSDIYVNKFSLTFPKSFLIHNIKAADDFGPVAPYLSEKGDRITIALKFSNPTTGKDSVNNFYLEFTQANLFKINGNIWEVILPTIENIADGSYKVIVNLPENSEKKISIAKPKPDLISGNQIIWDNPKTRTIYAVFGDRQFYQLNLNYYLNNSRVIPVYIDVAFPPETLYQKIYLQRITPLPYLVYLDEDGNFLGRYFLKPKEEIMVDFRGVAEIFSKPRQDFIPVINSQIKKQEKYLLRENEYWKLSQPEKFTFLKSSYEIYRFLVDSFSYDFKKIGNKEARLGADKALNNPKNAVCTEFTDAFVALSREKGIMAREIEGYGYSFEPHLRPISLTSDTLHAWPEFYHQEQKIWIPIDPTWENTSGIDYYSSFDLNHIVFVIHGKDAKFPYPAGMYKSKNSKDIIVKAIENKPEEIQKIELIPPDFKKQINDKDHYQTKFFLKNTGNVFLYNQKIKIISSDLNIKPTSFKIDLIAPLEKKEFNLEYFAKKTSFKKKALILINISDKKSYQKEIIIFPYHYQLILIISIMILCFSLLFLAFKIRLKKK